jgi:hypothetical protein
MATNGTSVLNQHIAIDQSPNKFLLFGITYLLATPSDFSKKVVVNGKLDTAMTTQFLTASGIENEAHQEILDFASSIVQDTTLRSTLGQLHDNLQSDFGELTYSPTPCPNGGDSVAIMKKMNELQKASAGASIQHANTSQPVGSIK